MSPAPESPADAALAALPGIEAQKIERGGRLQAPHRRQAGAPRLIEKVVVVAYRAGTWILGKLPYGPAVVVGGWIATLVYWVWPEKRRYVRANASHVLGLPIGDRRVDRLARSIYRNQVRWVLEMMRLPHQSRDEHVAQVGGSGPDDLRRAWTEMGGVVLAGLHLGNGEAVAAGMAGRGTHMYAVADDTAFPELFAIFTAQRRAWGIEIIPWRNLRAVYRVLRSRQILGLLVDWGYRPEDQPVRLFGDWTTLPAGPAVLAARTGAVILPYWTTRTREGAFIAEVGAPIRVASSEPAEIARATQMVADVLEAAIRANPEQWCVFKPMWPPSPAEAERLAARAAAILGAPGAAERPVGTGTEAPADGPPAMDEPHVGDADGLPTAVIGSAASEAGA